MKNINELIEEYVDVVKKQEDPNLIEILNDFNEGKTEYEQELISNHFDLFIESAKSELFYREEFKEYDLEI